MTMLIILALYHSAILIFAIFGVLAAIDAKDAGLAVFAAFIIAGSFATTFYFLTEILS